MIAKEPTKKTCQFCENNSYLGNYSRHLQNKHQKEWGVRQMIKTLNSVELEWVKRFIIEMKK